MCEATFDLRARSTTAARAKQRRLTRRVVGKWWSREGRPCAGAAEGDDEVVVGVVVEGVVVVGVGVEGVVGVGVGVEGVVGVEVGVEQPRYLAVRVKR